MIAFALAVALLQVGPKPTDRQSFMSGNQLHAICQDTSATGRTACQFYVTGALDMLFDQKGANSPCFPTTANREQAADIVRKYLADHPEERHFTMASLVRAAIYEAFPCK